MKRIYIINIIKLKYKFWWSFCVNRGKSNNDSRYFNWTKINLNCVEFINWIDVSMGFNSIIFHSLFFFFYFSHASFSSNYAFFIYYLLWKKFKSKFGSIYILIFCSMRIERISIISADETHNIVSNWLNFFLFV